MESISSNLVREERLASGLSPWKLGQYSLAEFSGLNIYLPEVSTLGIIFSMYTDYGVEKFNLLNYVCLISS